MAELFRTFRLIALWAAIGSFASEPSRAEPALAWDSIKKVQDAAVGDTNSFFTFGVTNVSSAEVLINSVKTSCGCTIPKLPPMPWRLLPGTNDLLQVQVDLRGKRGTLTKTVTVDSSAGMQFLAVSVNIPEPPQDRSRNMQIALADRQAVFRGDCASCHAHPTYGKKGPQLYEAACAICHDAEHRASMVPDLAALNKPTSASYWHQWIAHGKIGTLMPAFAQSAGGPLDQAQIQSLVEFLVEKYPSPESFGFGNPFPVDPSETGGGRLIEIKQ